MGKNQIFEPLALFWPNRAGRRMPGRYFSNNECTAGDAVEQAATTASSGYL